VNTNPVLSEIVSGSCVVNSACEFNVSATDVDNGDVLTYVWEINGTDINQTSANISHIFNTAGDYNVSVHVNDGTTNGVAVKTQVITVVEAGNNSVALTGDTNITVDQAKAVSSVSVEGVDDYVNSSLVINFTAKTVTTPDITGQPMIVKIDGAEKVIITPDALYHGSKFTIVDLNSGKSGEITYDKTLADQFVTLK